MVAQRSLKQAICDSKAFRDKGHPRKEDLPGPWRRPDEIAANNHFGSDDCNLDIIMTGEGSGAIMDLIDAFRVSHSHG